MEVSLPRSVAAARVAQASTGPVSNNSKLISHSRP